MPVLVVGSIALDNIKTPTAEHTQLLGGSASYAAVAASLMIERLCSMNFPSRCGDLESVLSFGAVCERKTCAAGPPDDAGPFRLFRPR